MRTLQSSVVATIILVLLGGLGSLALAQGDSDTEGSAESSLLSFTMPYGKHTTTGAVEVLEDRISYRDDGFVSSLDANDPRLSGEMWSIHDWDRHRDSQGAVITGIAGVDRDDGAWRGTFLGYATPNDERLMYQVSLVGEGVYEGLSAMLFISDNGSSFDVEGMVIPGELPPSPELPSWRRTAGSHGAARRVNPTHRLGCLRHGGDDPTWPPYIAIPGAVQ